MSDLVREGMAATYNPDDIELALIGSTADVRKRALMRLVAGAWKKGWDDCEEETRKILAVYNMAHLVPQGPVQ